MAGTEVVVVASEVDVDDGAAEVGVTVVDVAVVAVPGIDDVPATVIADELEDAVPLEPQPDMASATVIPRQGGIVLQRMGCSDSVVGAATVLPNGFRSASTRTQQPPSDFRRVAVIRIYCAEPISGPNVAMRGMRQCPGRLSGRRSDL